MATAPKTAWRPEAGSDFQTWTTATKAAIDPPNAKVTCAA